MKQQPSAPVFLVYSFDSTQKTNSLAYALALAPLMFALQGTKRAGFDVHIVKENTHETLVTFGRKGFVQLATAGQVAA